MEGKALEHSSIHFLPLIVHSYVEPVGNHSCFKVTIVSFQKGVGDLPSLLLFDNFIQMYSAYLYSSYFFLQKDVICLALSILTCHSFLVSLSAMHLHSPLFTEYNPRTPAVAPPDLHLSCSHKTSFHLFILPYRSHRLQQALSGNPQAILARNTGRLTADLDLSFHSSKSNPLVLSTAL